jgi:tight adherence protein C
MHMGIALFAIVLIAVSAALVVRAVTLPRARAARSLEQISSYGFSAGELVALPEEQPHVLDVLGAWVAQRLPRERRTTIRRKLFGAGLHETTLERFIGRWVVSLIGVPLVMIWFAVTTGAPAGIAFLEVIGGVVMGGLGPITIVNRRARLRLEDIDREIPELVDLLVVGIEGGIGFNGAIRTASRRVEGPLAEELQLMLQQQGLGASTTESLENMLERCETPAVRSFVRTIVQGERLGVPVGQLMRNLAEEMRKRRRATAEERAHKTPVKIIFPLVFMILPAMFIIVLTPSIAKLVDAFNSF